MSGRSSIVVVAITSALVVALGLAILAYVDENVVRFPWPVVAIAVPGAFTSIAYIVTLRRLARRDQDNLRAAIAVLVIWLIVCPILVAALVALTQWLTRSPPQYPAGIARISVHKVGQAAVRAALSVAVAAWRLVRALLRRPRRESARP